MENLNLKNLERKSTTGIFNTGLVDMAVGMTFIITSLAGIFDAYRYYIDALLILPVILLYWSIRKIAQPRIGTVVPGKKRKNRIRNFSLAMTSFLLIMVSLTYFGSGNWTEQFMNPRLIISFIIFLIFALVAFFYDFKRMYIYGFLITGAFNLMEILREVPEWREFSYGVYLVAAFIIAGTGLLLFIKFLQNNPLPSKPIEYERG